MGSNVRDVVRGAIARRGAAPIQILQDVQQALGYVPEIAVDMMAEELEIPATQIYGILTFYAQFRLAPPGKHSLRVCQGTACHVMGSERILDYLQGVLGVGVGETTEDRRFTLERVACVGCCGMAPVVVLDGVPHGNMSIRAVEALIGAYGKSAHGHSAEV
ncbi:MAG: NAD(P)H-dependent oxidoreductase subunit E [Candidatus Thermoplasmatota archaeon]